MLHAVIDWGNTRIKVGIFEENLLKEKLVSTNLEEVVGFLRKFPKVSGGIISTVAGEPTLLISKLNPAYKFFILSDSTPLPFFNHYTTKATQGKDRIAAIAGAVSLFEGEAMLVIDAGTCITYDYVDAEANYEGGIIAPGIAMRLKSMHAFTSNLPELALQQERPALLGKSTVSCMQSGALWGVASEMDGIIENIKRERGEMKVLICGGDADRFESIVKAPIFAIPELVLVGLNAILEHNEV